MMELEKLDLAEIRDISHEGGTYFARLALRDESLLEGRIIADGYRMVTYGFVWAEEMPEMVHLGEKVGPSGFRMYDLRVIAAFVQALGLSGDWDPDGNPPPDLDSIRIPGIEEARTILKNAGVPLKAL